VRVEPVGRQLQGFEVASQEADPDTTVVTGAESLVALVESAVAEVNIAGARVDVQEADVELNARDARDNEISRVTLDPATADVVVDLEQREFSLVFAVSPVVTGQPAAGYNVAGVAADPAVVTVTGALEVLQSIDAVRGIPTEEVSIADARGDVVQEVRLALPDGARVQGDDTVTVSVSIAATRGEASFVVVPRVQNIADGLVVTQANPVTVVLAGELPVLDATTPESITVTANAEGLGAGLYALPLDVTAPAGTTVVRTEPDALGIALVPRP
jgi:YbbR domain-containing protein